MNADFAAERFAGGGRPMLIGRVLQIRFVCVFLVLHLGSLLFAMPAFSQDSAEQESVVLQLAWMQWVLGIAVGIALLAGLGALIIVLYNRRLKATIAEGRQAKLINDTLFQISNAVSTTQNLEELYATIHAALSRIIELPNLFIALYYREQDRITFPYYVDEYDTEAEIIENFTERDSLTAEVIKARQPIFLTEAMLQERVRQQRIIGTPPKIWLGIPLLIKGEVIGIMAVQHYTDPRHFHKRDLDVLVAVSDQIAVAIERKTAQEALRESEEKYRELVQSANSIILRTDFEGRITFINDFGQQFLGYAGEELLGYMVVGTIVPETERSGRDLTRLFQDLYKHPEQYVHFENENVRKNGERVWVLWANKVVKNKQGENVELLSIGNDITEKKELEKQLNQAQKIEALGTLTGGIAHDFNNILGIILGYTEIAQVQLPDSSPVRQSLEEVKSASLRARDIVSQLLAFTRRGEQQQKTLDIRPMIKEGLKMLRSTIPTSIEFQSIIPSALPPVKTDGTQIHQILVNLCTNASHAMEAGGVLTVGLEEVSLQQQDLAFDPDLTPGRYIKLWVSDTGQGIPQEDRERIFDPYFTTKEVGKGSGLGLSVVLGIVKNHEGGVRVRSQIGKGTTVEIYLPAAAETPQAEEPVITPDLPRGSEQILFVDDEVMIVDINQQRLEGLGYAMTGSTDPVQALALFRENPERFDLVITDMTMPKMNGDALSQEILKTRPEMPVILCTGHSETMSRTRAKAIGLAGFLEKPLDMATLAFTVREVLDGKPAG